MMELLRKSKIFIFLIYGFKINWAVLQFLWGSLVEFIISKWHSNYYTKLKCVDEMILWDVWRIGGVLRIVSNYRPYSSLQHVLHFCTASFVQLSSPMAWRVQQVALEETGWNSICKFCELNNDLQDNSLKAWCFLNAKWRKCFHILGKN